MSKLHCPRFIGGSKLPLYPIFVRLGDHPDYGLIKTDS